MMEPPDHMCEPPRTQEVDLFTVLMGGVKWTLPFTSISSSEELIHITTQLYFTKKLDSAKILGQEGSWEGAGRCPGAWLVMGVVPPAGMCDPRRGCGDPETVGPALGAPGDWHDCLPSQPRNGRLPLGWRKGRKDKARRVNLA